MNKSVTLLLSCILMISGLLLKAQKPEVVEGELLVQVLPGHTGQEVAKFLNEQFGPQAQARAFRELSARSHIWQIKFNSQNLSNQAALDLAWAQPSVTIAQFNHVLTNRATIPNDPSFNSQWQYINTGQSGGTPGADIDMDDAWDITTGGLTPLGDTIVACIIDDGLDPTHQDFGNNIWINHNEIPNNGIDDDNNGFIDDYRGWDAYNNNDNIYTGGGHGTAVTGIVGAKGNNGIGVAGVNWDVKLMIVRGGGNEAEAIAAYSYPLEMRKLYNQTNGAQGAYVVTTNASWGVNFGQPSAAPLWCAMYDSLGKYGIISCGATANLNIDIDQDGDLPTACPSDYLISVTNMNHNDAKVTVAGYGLTTIDLGAFGEDTYTTSFGNSYGGFGGTSGATPHVTGTVALLYSAACPNFAQVAKTQPDSAARLVKQWIIDGVDANTSLNGITTTGGRLNVFNSLNLLNGYDCSGTGCFSAYSLGIQNPTDTSATLHWTGTAAVDTFHVQFRPVGASVWTSFYDTSNSRSVDTLQSCTQYEFRVETICDTLLGNFTSVYQFVTEGCCEAPGGFSDTTFATSSTISFDSVLAAQSYTLRYRAVGNPSWTVVPGLTTVDYDILGLDSCSDYEYQVQTVCDTGSTPFGNLQTFKTVGCVGCEQSFCASNGGDNSLEWIENVSISNLTNTSSSASGGYADYTGQMVADLKRDSIYSLSLSPGFSSGSFPEVFSIWIDLNQDGDFDDLGEDIFTSSPTTTTVNDLLTIPLTASLGICRMRVAMRYDVAAGSCTPNFDFGEVEDYCVNILPAPVVSVDGRLERSLRIYPNPFNQELNISFSNEILTDCTVKLYSIEGKLLRSEDFTDLSSGVQKLSVQTTDLNTGMYVLEISLGGQYIHKKLTLIK